MQNTCNYSFLLLFVKVLKSWLNVFIMQADKAGGDVGCREGFIKQFVFKLLHLLTSSFIVINIDPLQLQFALSSVNSAWVNAVFFRNNFPKLKKNVARLIIWNDERLTFSCCLTATVETDH